MPSFTGAGNTVAGSPLAVDVWEAARILSISPFTIRNYIRDGELKVSHLGRRVVIPVSELQRLLERGAASRKGAKQHADANLQR
jgi:excisionase family DNA binding protein